MFLCVYLPSFLSLFFLNICVNIRGPPQRWSQNDNTDYFCVKISSDMISFCTFLCVLHFKIMSMNHYKTFVIFIKCYTCSLQKFSNIHIKKRTLPPRYIYHGNPILLVASNEQCFWVFMLHAVPSHADSEVGHMWWLILCAYLARLSCQVIILLLLLNTSLGVVVKVFFKDVINSQISQLMSKADYTSYCGWASFNQL